MAPLVSSLFSSAVEGIGTWPVLAGAVAMIVLIVVIALCLGHGGSTKRNGNDVTGKNGEPTNSVAINHRKKLDEPGAISYENNTATDRALNAGRKQQTSSSVLSGDGVQHSIGNKSISASVPALYTNPNSMMVTLSGSRQFGHGLNVATSSDGSGGVVVNSIDKNGSESASNNVARGSRIVSLTVLFDKDIDIKDVRKLLDCVAPYQIRLEVDTTGSQSDVKSTTVQVLRHDDASVEHEGQRRTVSLDGPAFHSNVAGDSGRGGMTMRGLPEADIDLPDGRMTLGINAELDDDALAAALNEIEAINIRDGQLRLQDGHGSEEDVFELAVGTRASAPEVAVIHGGDLVVEEPTIGTLDAGLTFSFDDVVIDAPEAFGMRGDTDVLRSEPTSGYVHFTAASPKIANEQAGKFKDSELTKNGEVAAEVSMSDDVQPLQQLPEADTAVGEIDTVATELDQFVPDTDSVSTNVSRESFNVELPADYAPVVRATYGRTEETVGAKSSDNPALEISAPEIENNLELLVEVRGVELPTSSNNGTKKRPTVMSTLGRFGVIDLTQTEAADPFSSEADVVVASPITETSSLQMESAQVDVSAGQSTEGLIITDEAEAQLPTTNLAVSRDVGPQLESSPEVIHVESMQHGIMELARAERGTAAPTIQVHTTPSGVHGVNARPEVDVSQKVGAAKRKSGLFANIFHKKDKKKEAAAVVLPLIPTGHVHKPATAIASQASTEDTPHVNLSVSPVRVVGQNGPGSIIANAEAPPRVALLSPSADVIEAPFSPTDVTASAAFSVPTIGASVESPEIDASLDGTETRLGAEIQMEPPEVEGWRMATDEMSDGVSGKVYEPEAVDVSQSISSSAAVPYEPNVELETGNSVSPNLYSSFFTESLDTPAAEASDAELSAERDLESSSVTVDLDPTLIAPSLQTRERATDKPLRVELSSVAGTEQRSFGVEVLATVEQPAVGHAVKSASPSSPTSPTSPTSKEDKKSGGKVHHSWNPFKSRSSKKTDKSISGVGTENDASAHRPQSRVGSTSPSVSLEGEVKLLPSGSPVGYESEKNLKHLGVEGKTTAVTAASSVVDTPELVVIGDVLSTVVAPIESEASRGTAMGSKSHPLPADVNASQLEIAGDESMESSLEKSIVSAEAVVPEHHPLRASPSEPAALTSSKPAATAEIKGHKKGGAFGGLKNIFKSRSNRKSESDHQQGTSGNQLTTAATVGQTTHVGNGKQVNLETAGVVYSPSTHIAVDKSDKVEEDVPRKQNNPEIAAALGLLVSDVSGYADNGISGETTPDIPRDQDIPHDQAAVPTSSDERETFDDEHEELCPQLEAEDRRLLENGIHTTLAAAAVDEPNSTGSIDDDSGKKTGSDDDFDAEYEKPYHALPELSPDSGEFEFALTLSGMDLSADAMLRTLGLRPMSVEEIANESKDFGDDDVSPDTNGNSDHVTKSSSSPTLGRHNDHDVDHHRHSSARKFDDDQSSPDLLHDGLATFGRLERAPETTDLSGYELPSNSSDKPSPLSSSDDEDSYERDLPPTSPPPPPPLDGPQPSEMKVKMANGRSHIPHDDDGNEDNDGGKSQRRGDFVLHPEERKPVTKRMAPIAGDLNNNETSLRTSLQSSPS